MLTPTGNEAYKKAFHEQVEPEWKERMDEFCPMNRPRTICPALPWQSDRLPGEKWSDYAKRTGKAEGA